MGRGIAGRHQIHDLLRHGIRGRAGFEFRRAQPRRQRGRSGRCALRYGPAGQPVFEIAVGDEISRAVEADEGAGRVAGVRGRIGRLLARNFRPRDQEAVGVFAEMRFRPFRIDDRHAYRMQVELVNVILPVENVDEILRPIDDLASVGRKQRVVVAPESGLAVVVDIDAVAGIGPDDVGDDGDVVRALGQMDGVADVGNEGYCRRSERRRRLR